MQVLWCCFKADFIAEAQLYNYKQAYVMEINSMDQRFSAGVTRKALRCAAGFCGKVKKKRENFKEYKNRRNT
jgi:hypothetical protein